MSTTEIPGGTPGFESQELLAVLEPGQLTGAKRAQLPRRYLKGPELVVLWSLRLYLFFMIVVVIYQLFAGVD
ncbi:MAG TPA: hypothetical protein VJA94_10945 [Candidatus Angelobacter sp.]